MGISQKIINEVFFYHIERDNEENCKGQEMETIENMRKHDEKTRVGYGKAGVESLVSLIILSAFEGNNFVILILISWKISSVKTQKRPRILWIYCATN